VWVFFAQVPVYCLSLGFSLSSSYDLQFDPQVLVQQLPRYSLVFGSSYSVQTRPLAWNFSVSSVALEVNITALNVNGSIFFSGRLAFNTLALDRIQLYHTYDPALKSQNITLTVDAILSIDFENQTDVYREVHNSWQLQLP
jgi:hypothetical protein